MFNLPSKCVRCGTSLKRQIIGSNNFYYCRKCGCTSSTTAAGVSSQPAVQRVMNI
ncbi:hypothetical protein RSJ42_07910 [Methanosarcina hadiensis]|uniref:hypothetical protein n=1 Tax=Methanosarcina hadiensis TaxID=3078083 RepID=UPI0039775BCC